MKRQRVANGERQRMANSEWRMVKRQRVANSQWRIVYWRDDQPQNFPVANRQSPIASFPSPVPNTQSPITTRHSLLTTRCRFAFTLTELLTVLAIIAILMGILVTFYRPSQEQRKVFECQNRLVVIYRALRMYSLDWDGFPASPYDSLDNDGDGRFDEDPINGIDDDRDGDFDEDGIDAQVGGLLALDQYIRSRRTLICPSDARAFSGAPDTYTSYQVCDAGTNFYEPIFPITSSQQGSCLQAGGVPTYAITRFLPTDPCHSSNLFPTDPSRPKPNCDDQDRFRQLAVRNVSPYFPVPQFPLDDTVVSWCVHHRFMPNTRTPNYTKGGEPADVVLYLDGSVRIQQMRAPNLNWRRKPNEP